MTNIRHDLARNTLAILCILGLIAMSLWVLRPFLAAAVWATMIVVATWPMLKSLESRLGQRRGAAVALLTLAMLLLLVLPFWLVVEAIADHSDQLSWLIKSITTNGLPMPPEWVANLPWFGRKLAQAWRQLATSGAAGMVALLTPYAADTGKLALAWLGGLGGMLIQLLLIITLSAIFYSGGEAGALMVRRFGLRLAGERGENAIILAAQAIRGVALGVGVTALVQTLLGGLGLALAGVPFAALLAVLMLVFCLAQLGPTLVLLPAVGWMYWQGETSGAIGLLVWSVMVAGLDNFLRPLLIRRGADLPLLLIFSGVIGGLISFGLIGIFLGPVALAVTWTLMQAWVADVPLAEEKAALALTQPDSSEPAAG